MGMTMKQGLSLIDRVTKKAAVGHIHVSHATAFLDEIEKSVEEERAACAEIAKAFGVGRDGSTRAICNQIAEQIQERS